MVSVSVFGVRVSAMFHFMLQFMFINFLLLFKTLFLTHLANEPRHEKTGFLHMRKQRRISASSLPRS